MRLAQAARDLSITTDDIIAFLNKKGIAVEKDSNTKLNEESVSLLFNHFGAEKVTKSKAIDTSAKEDSSSTKPEKTESTTLTTASETENSEMTEPIYDVAEKPENLEEHNSINNPTEADEIIDSPEKEEIAVAHINVDEKPFDEQEEVNEVQEESTLKNYKTVADILASEINNEDDDIVIKAPKVALKGLNVLGKIDLPEPKPKSEKEAAESEKDKDKDKDKLRREKRQSRKPKERSGRHKRELTPQQVREREKKKEARKLEEAERLRKKKKEAYYQQKVLKPTQEKQKKTKPKKVKRSNPEQVKKKTKPQPTTILGKFWRWLNT